MLKAKIDQLLLDFFPWREGLAGKAALLIKVKDQGSSAFVLWEYPPFNMDIND